MSRNQATPASVQEVIKADIQPTKVSAAVSAPTRHARVAQKLAAAEQVRLKDDKVPHEVSAEDQTEAQALAGIEGAGSGSIAEATEYGYQTAQAPVPLLDVAATGVAAGVTGVGLAGNATGLTGSLGMAGTASVAGAVYTTNMAFIGVGGGVAAASIGRSSSASPIAVETPRPSTNMKITSIDRDTGVSSSDFITRDTTPKVKGTLTGEWRSGDKAQISVDGVNWIDLSIRDGSWSFNDPRTLEDGRHTYHVRVIDQAGQLIERNRQTVNVDSQAPTAIIEMVAIDNDTGSNSTDWITYDQSLTFSGTLTGVLNPGETAQISWDGVIWHDLSVQGGDWSIRRSLREGEHTVQTRIIDTAGNTASMDPRLLVINSDADVFTITETSAEGSLLRLAMKVGDRFEVVRDENYAITGYTFNGVPAPNELVQAFLGAQAALPTELRTLFDRVEWIYDENWELVDYGIWNDERTAYTPLEESLVPLYLSRYSYQQGFTDRLTDEYFGTDSTLGYYFDAVETRDDGTYLIGSPDRMAYLTLQSGVRSVADGVAIRLYPEIFGAFFVEADAAQVNFSAARSSPDAFTKLESVSVFTEQDSQLFFKNNGGANFAQALKEIHVEVTNDLDGSANVNVSAWTSGWARVDMSATTNDDTDETVVDFMSALETITVIGANANADLDITASGGDYFLSALKSIHVEAGGEGNVAYLSIKASANSYWDADDDIVNYTNDYFMHKLESIKVISADALATFSLSASGGSHFMDSLKTISVEARYEARVQISASVNYAGATGDNFMAALESISIKNTGREDVGRFDRVSLSISNGDLGGDMFMASLKSIRLEGGINNNALLEVDNHAGNGFMGALERVEVLASDNGYAVAELRNFVHEIENRDSDWNLIGTDTFVGDGFMSNLSAVEVAGLNAFVSLGGAVGKSEGTITMDLTGVGGAERSLAVVTTQDADFGEGATTTLVTKIGTSNLQVNAVYEVNNEWTMNEYIWDNDLGEYIENPNYIPDSEREFLYEDLFTNTAENQVGDAEARRTISMTEEPYSDTNNGGLRTIDGISDFVGFAGLNLSAGGSDYPAGWVDMGGNGIKDIFQFTSADMGNVVMGGFEDGQDVFDFSLINALNGVVNDQSATSSDHVATAAGGILVTQVEGTDDIKIWLNTDGGNTAAFADFESWIYVVDNSTMTWNVSDFIFV